MRILQLGKFYPPHRGGMESALRDLCRGLAQRNHEVAVIVSADDTTHHRESLEGIQLERVPSFGTVRSVPICPELGGAVRRWVRKLNPDVVHLHLPNPGAALAWWVSARSTRLVVSYHSDIVRQRVLSSVWQPWRRQVLGHARAIVCSSEGLRDAATGLEPYRDRCNVIPFFVSLDWFDATPRTDVQEVLQEWGERFFLFVGRHVYYKGVPQLLEAVRGTDMKLVIVGDGPLRDDWETMASHDQRLANVRFVGEVDSQRLRALYHACTALVLPSIAKSETFGIVQLEAMACGRPVVVTDASEGLASVQSDGETGFVVPTGDVEALRIHLARLWGDPALADRLGKAGRDRIEAFYDRERVLDRWEQLFESVIEDASPLRSSP